MIELDVYAVLYSLISRHRVVLLKESQGEHLLPIWIGMYESDAIATRLQGVSVPRPLTHDLLASIITQMDGMVRYVLINDLTDSTFYARIAIEYQGELKMVDSRPSDAIALAVRASVPIYVDERVIEKAGIVASTPIRSGNATDQDGLDIFRNFVDSLDLGDLKE